MINNEVEFLAGWELDPADPAAAQSRAQEEMLFHVAQAVGAHHINVGELTGTGALVLDPIIARFGALCDRAGERGLSIALEFMPFSIIHDLRTAIDIVRGADAKNGGVLIDTWHFHRSGQDWLTLQSISPSDLMAIQLNDVRDPLSGTLFQDCIRRLPPGEGDINLDRFIATLIKIGCRLPLAVEILSPEQAALPVDEAARVAHSATRQVIDRASERLAGASGVDAGTPA
jgi:sugar phosphate isomerase/epimerase